MSTHIVDVASCDAKSVQLHDARRARVDVQHTAPTRGAPLCFQGDRGSRRRLKDDAPGDAELGGEVVGAGGKDDAAGGGVGDCTGQASAGAHRGLQLTAVAGHRELQTLAQPGNVAGLGAGQHGAPCKEGEGTAHALLLSRPMWPRARIGETTVPCHERCHQQAPPRTQAAGESKDANWASQLIGQSVNAVGRK